VIDSGYLDWPVAEAQAGSMFFNGMQGYLATVTSQAENDFLVSTFGVDALSSKWLGGFRLDITSPDPKQGWGWITGEPWAYTNWALGELNNAHLYETALQYTFDTSFPYIGHWNDLRPVGDGRSNGFVIEYGLGTASIPEPSSLVLIGLGVAGVVGYARETPGR
jgi:hypothetical protein